MKKKVVMGNFEKGATLMTISGLSMSAFTLFIKLGIGFPNLPTFVFVRFFIPLVMLFPFVIGLKSFSIKIPAKRVGSFFARSIFVLVSQYSLFFYLTKASLFDATVLFNSATIFLPIFSYLFLGIKIRKRTMFAIIISLFGIGLILKPTTGLFSIYSFFGLLSGMSMALSQIVYGEGVRKGQVFIQTFYFFFFGAILSSIPLLTLYFFFPENPFVISGAQLWGEVHHIIPYLIAIGLASISVQFLRGAAYLKTKPSFLAPFMYTAVVFSAFYDWVIFGIKLDVMAIFGCILVIFGASIPLIWEGIGRKRLNKL